MRRKIKLVSMELAVLFGFTVYGMFIFNEGMNKVALTTSLLRIWLGYKLMHDIFVGEVTRFKWFNKLGSGEKLAEVFQFIVEKHWGIVGSIVEILFLPFTDFWAIVFAVTQTAVAVMLVLNSYTFC
ncbi:hypothetical protein KHA80_08600 [Anaerobacillus sp. HL2]|nr:hypothetical protein KHA80_08600 [Anaerobacillus sp. HL2]